MFDVVGCEEDEGDLEESEVAEEDDAFDDSVTVHFVCCSMFAVATFEMVSVGVSRETVAFDVAGSGNDG